MSSVLQPVSPPGWRERLDQVRRLVVERPLAVAAGAVALVVGGFAAVLVLWVPRSAPPLDLPTAQSSSSRPSASRAPAEGAVSSSGGGVPATNGASEVVVHVVGAVQRPGLVRLRPGARAADAVEASGGLRPDADLERLNLAAPVSDGQRLFVPIRGQPVPQEVGLGPGTAGAGGASSKSNGEVLNLNTATVEELDALPGVGPATAQAIVDYRRTKGSFRAVDQLREVRGIGEAKLAQLRPRVRV